jgi:hypothetical protein
MIICSSQSTGFGAALQVAGNVRRTFRRIAGAAPSAIADTNPWDASLPGEKGARLFTTDAVPQHRVLSTSQNGESALAK